MWKHQKQQQGDSSCTLETSALDSRDPPTSRENTSPSPHIPRARSAPYPAHTQDLTRTPSPSSKLQGYFTAFILLCLSDWLPLSCLLGCHLVLFCYLCVWVFFPPPSGLLFLSFFPFCSLFLFFTV